MTTLLFIVEIGAVLALLIWAYRNEAPGRRTGASGLFAIITDQGPPPRSQRKGAPAWQARSPTSPEAEPATAPAVQRRVAWRRASFHRPRTPGR